MRSESLRRCESTNWKNYGVVDGPMSLFDFGKTAEFFEKFGRKGTKFLIEGRIQTGSYENKDGQKVYTTDVVVEQTEFAESKATANNGVNAETERQPQPSPMPTGSGFMNVPDGIEEELPFN